MDGSEAGKLIDAVLAYGLTIDPERDQWEKAPIMGAVQIWGTNEQKALVRRWVDRAVTTQTSNGSFSFNDRLHFSEGHLLVLNATPVLPTVVGNRVLQYHQMTGEPAYRAAADYLAQCLMDPRLTPRCSNGGFWNAYEGAELHIDIVYMVSPFLARYATVAGDRKWADEAVLQLDTHMDKLFDHRRNLCRHTWREVPDTFPSSIFWSRGNAWLFCALFETYELLEQDHPARTRIGELANAHLHGVAAFQDRSGYFRNVLDDPTAKLETSGTLMFAYAVGRGIQLGIVDPDLEAAAVKAWRVAAGGVSRAGAVTGVAVQPGGPKVPFGSNSFGQGFFVLAADALRRPLGLPS